LPSGRRTRLCLVRRPSRTPSRSSRRSICTGLGCRRCACTTPLGSRNSARRHSSWYRSWSTPESWKRFSRRTPTRCLGPRVDRPSRSIFRYDGAQSIRQAYHLKTNGQRIWTNCCIVGGAPPKFVPSPGGIRVPI